MFFLAGALALSAVLPAGAQDSTATVELRVWQRIESPLRIYVSARHEAGSWATLGTIPLSLDHETVVARSVTVTSPSKCRWPRGV